MIAMKKWLPFMILLATAIIVGFSAFLGGQTDYSVTTI